MPLPILFSIVFKCGGLIYIVNCLKALFKLFFIKQINFHNMGQINNKEE